MSMNRVWILGDVSQYGFTLRQGEKSPCATGSLVVTEQLATGKPFSTFVTVDVWGKGAEAATTLAPGATVTLEGKVARRKGKDGQWDMVVSCYKLDVVKESPLRTTAA